MACSGRTVTAAAVLVVTVVFVPGGGELTRAKEVRAELRTKLPQRPGSTRNVRCHLMSGRFLIGRGRMGRADARPHSAVYARPTGRTSEVPSSPMPDPEAGG